MYILGYLMNPPGYTGFILSNYLIYIGIMACFLNFQNHVNMIWHNNIFINMNTIIKHIYLF